MTKLAVLNMGAHGHINPTLPVIAELIRRGVDVLYFAPEEFAPQVKATGARFQAYDSEFTRAGSQMQSSAGVDGDELAARIPLRLLSEAEHVLPQVLEALRGEHCDGLIYDNMCLAGQFAAAILKIPAMQFRPSYAANEHFSLGKLLAKTSADHPARQEFRTRASTFAQRYNVPALEAHKIFAHIEPMSIVFMPRSFQPMGDTFDERFTFVGASIAPRATAGSWQPPAGGKKPLLFISLGTVFNNWADFFHTCFEAFGGKPWDVLIAIGDKVDPASLGPAPANFTLAKHVPQLEVLPHTSVFITHGGMNSTQESLWFGVPMVVIPQMMEQAQTAERIVELGLGKALLTRAAVTPGSLIAAVQEIETDSKYRVNAAAMQKQARACGGYQQAADVIEKQLNSSPTSTKSRP